jgi:NTE family protein
MVAEPTPPHEGPGFLHGAKLSKGVVLCLSGGGYRATLFHLGAILRLNELGLLPQLDRVSSVSGGSITAGVLALGWRHLNFTAEGMATNIGSTVVKPVLRMVETTVDVWSVLKGLLPWKRAGNAIASAYDKILFHGATLQDLPKRPRFVFNATSLQTGTLWRISSDYAVDRRVGQILSPEFSLAEVVAASSAFPPILSPVRLDLSPYTVEPLPGADMHREPFTKEAILTDGGVYDNLGLETGWKRYLTVLVSNAGRNVPQIGKPTGKWVGQLHRVIGVLHSQGENIRERVLIDLFKNKHRSGAYWSIDTPIGAFSVDNVVSISDREARRSAETRTRLNRFTKDEQELLVKHGYALADAAIRAYYKPDASPPSGPPIYLGYDP